MARPDGSEGEGFILIAADNPAGFYDALAASPFAFANTIPILSVKKGSVPTSVGRVLKASQFKAKPRYAASSAAYIGTGGLASATRMTPGHTGLVAGLSNALAGGAFLGKGGGVLLFTDASKTIQLASRAFITAQRSEIASGWVIGGTNVLPTAQETSFRNLLK